MKRNRNLVAHIHVDYSETFIYIQMISLLFSGESLSTHPVRAEKPCVRTGSAAAQRAGRVSSRSCQTAEGTVEKVQS